jgi:Lon protease-like protein
MDEAMSTDDPIPELTADHLVGLPLFPLPNVVFFPNARLPLHVFEVRYRQLVEDAIEQHLPVAIPLLKRGFEEDYEGTPEIHDVCGVGWIVEHDPLPDGRSLIRLQGVARVRILDEPDSDRPYRLARAEVLPTVWPVDRRRVLDVVERIKQLAMALLLSGPELAGPVKAVLRLADDPEALADLLAAAFVQDVELRQQVLAEPRLDVRLEAASEGLTALMLTAE